MLDHQELKKESSEWNFCPPPEDFRKVSDVAKEVEKNFKFNIGWSEKNNDGMHEEEYLVLNSTKATLELGWLPRLNFEQGIRWTVEWQNRVINGADAIDACLFDIQKYLNLVNKNL